MSWPQSLGSSGTKQISQGASSRAKASAMASGATPASEWLASIRKRRPCWCNTRPGPSISRTWASTAWDCTGRTSTPLSSSTDVIRNTPRIQCLYVKSGPLEAPPMLASSNCASSIVEKRSCDAMTQRASTSAAISGPVKEAMSSCRVGGSQVNSALHTLHVWCRRSRSWNAGCVGWDTSVVRCHWIKQCLWTHFCPPEHLQGLIRPSVFSSSRQ
mmetsp:Transcript_28043/g.84559  ORF Transcript_28043/g.84559 Transcript_28043/m.84559 type:complete len:215 (-) Transcript_28043:32-676(-)